MRNLNTNHTSEGILSAIGNTPLVSLTRIFSDIPFRLYAKLESLNPGGSMKDRSALSILTQAMRTGVIGPETVIIESSSGNMGIGLAQACAYLGLKFVCVIDTKITTQNLQILKAYGATIELVTEPHPETNEFLRARLDRVKALSEEIENSFWPDQYSNIYNSIGHHQTMNEITEALRAEPDYIFCATSTCGTLRGCADYVKQQGFSTKIVAVDAVGSVIFGGPKKKRLIPGHGAAICPPLFQSDLATQCVHVTDLECVVGCRRLARHEAILAGGSSGGVVSAVARFKDQVRKDATCVLILADRGERYLDTIYSDEWVEKHFGEVSHLWEETAELETCATVVC